MLDNQTPQPTAQTGPARGTDAPVKVDATMEAAAAMDSDAALSMDSGATMESPPAEAGLVMRSIRKPDGRYLLLYTFLRESPE